MRHPFYLFFILLFLSSCKDVLLSPATASTNAKKSLALPLNIGSIPTPEGYKRVSITNGSFGEWLRKMPLRNDNVLRLYNGSPKPNQQLHYAILDVPYNRDPLQQCADAVMRLRAEYIYETKCQPDISFLHQNIHYFTCSSNSSRKQLEAFLQKVFSWCGTYNLQVQLQAVKQIKEITPGDVFIRAGSPGHAMLVADVAINSKGEKLFLLLQSFIPAQEIHIVKNIYQPQLGAWYSTSDSLINTPGWQFKPNDLRRWRDSE